MSSTGMNYCVREITEEQYERAMRNNTQLTDEDFCEVFTEAERCGYGIYNHHVTTGFGKNRGLFFVVYEIGESCD